MGCTLSAMAFQPMHSPSTRMYLGQGSPTFSMLPSFLSDEPMMSNAMSPVLSTLDVSTISTTSLWLADTSAIIDILRTIAVGITALLIFLAGSTLLLANIIIPAAAKELEKECNELAPELWVEYQAKLEPGQTMANRPDLMQELGAKLQPLLDAKIARMEFQKDNNNNNQIITTTSRDVDDEDDDWNTRPQVDLSALTDQIPSPSKTIDAEKKE
jgi:hypothetical protein